MASTSPTTVDVLIIGGGPAGLGAALSLSRMLISCAIFDSGLYRNRFASHMHTVPTWDHRPPAEYLEAARKELVAGRYTTTQIHEVEITKLEKIQGGEDGDNEGAFLATAANGHQWRGKKVVLAVGSRDIYPDIKGVDTVWGNAIFHCLFCHGFESRGTELAGVLAIDPMAEAVPVMHIVAQARRFAGEVIIFTQRDEGLGEKLGSLMQGKERVRVENRKIVEFIKTPTHKPDREGGVTVVLEDGEKLELGFIAHRPHTVMNGPFAEQLGLETTAVGDVVVKGMFQETSVKGVFGVGDVSTFIKSVSYAQYSGTLGGAGIVNQLLH